MAHHDAHVRVVDGGHATERRRGQGVGRSILFAHLRLGTLLAERAKGKGVNREPRMDAHRDRDKPDAQTDGLTVCSQIDKMTKIEYLSLS